MIEVIRTRRNIKKFKPDEVKEEDLMTWLQAASMAPNHRMTEPWEILFLGKETREKLNHKTNFGNAPVVMAVLSKNGRTHIELTENALATACFIQNFNLAAWADGVGTFWSSIGASERNREILGVPDGYEVIGVLGVGYPEIIPEPKPRKPISEKIKRLP
ncbi:nitroreductase [Neobacillus cucumis]|uniref:nitroreductase family protein n=1 Tax=Neobacillus cucumis TaxID=1740721 RepID=UPI002042177F|nr:nitroreductase [Neobacillus cucumis]MCM3724145.1 nitroreductase [Neobacillus cucumis]